ncbi:4'-phosphopantetheinyl transferase superfamily protein [Acinetobacter sp. WCHAc010034]|uniref:4'-phosphopantetheinyl transferase family protein n=1 Tax=Acinetobacter sp. WCHAc010034 TaxID=1879049 RepID=UPI00083A9FFF|nr:4'-phosphopantetheinyl transferase superfamily protein [Acinetobacter sp. WCHAc010034]AYA03750.1 4'-phosphopantetheinyl transferase superfamily protein [Acinetobacter sp. WCHAc010034]
MTKPRAIQIYLHALSQLAPLDKAGFADLRQYSRYKKQQIYAQRNAHLSAFSGQPVADADIALSAYGKPFLKHRPEIAFNHSHSQKNYALALSAGMQDIGIDVEDLERKVRFEALARHAFHPRELDAWNASGQQPEYWFKVWTAKEAVLKAAGLGIRMSLNELDTQAHPEQNGGVCSHPSLGVFAYQNFQLAHVMLTVAWRSELSCRGFAFPDIQLLQR